jgi:hypothetical protein
MDRKEIIIWVLPQRYKIRSQDHIRTMVEMNQVGRSATPHPPADNSHCRRFVPIFWYIPAVNIRERTSLHH